MLEFRSVAKLFLFLHVIAGLALLGTIPIVHAHYAIVRCCGWWAVPATISLAVTEGMLLALVCIVTTERGWLD